MGNEMENRQQEPDCLREKKREQHIVCTIHLVQTTQFTLKHEKTGETNTVYVSSQCINIHIGTFREKI